MRPKIIAFYAYKGGTGRTFALAHTAWALARDGRRIVLIDLDLSAPSLWALLGRAPTEGLVEYVRQWSRKPLPVRQIIEEIPLDSKASGALYLLQAGKMDRAYLETLQTLDWQSLIDGSRQSLRQPDMLFNLVSPFQDLFDQITTDLQPDAIMIDAPTGFNDTSSLCLRVLADLVIAFFAPARVHLEGIGKVVSLLTAEQWTRRERGEDALPDVYCVASTILLSRLAGPHFRRIEKAFQYFEQVRVEALEGSEYPQVDKDELSQQEPAVVAYDERLADLEVLPTKDEPGETHFSSFYDIITYVEGSLPPPLERVEVQLDTKKGFLRDLKPHFHLFAEQEGKGLLDDSLFLRTRHVQEFKDPRTVLVLGGKGSGKTALFLYETKRPGAVAIAVHGPGKGLGSDLLCNIQDAVPSMDVFWRLYILAALEDPLQISNSAVQAAASLIPKLPEHPELLAPFIQQLQMPGIEVWVNKVWKEIDDSLLASNRRFVFCIDGLDSAFKADSKRREQGLTHLFLGWQATFSKLQRVELKVFLRSDLWQRVAFPEKSHLRGRELKLSWTGPDLWRLILKRAIASKEFNDWCKQSIINPIVSESVETTGEIALFPYLDRLFERHIWAGKNSLSRNWILRRLTDAKDTIYPRDLICLLDESIRLECERIQENQRTSEFSVISRQSLSEALTPSSEQRVNALREEYPELGELIDSLTGIVATGNIETLKGKIGDEGIRVLSDVGVIGLKEESYVVSDLYRHGLNMPRPGPR